MGFLFVPLNSGCSFMRRQQVCWPAGGSFSSSNGTRSSTPAPAPPRRVEFAVDTPTLAAGSVCDGRRLVQAFPQGVRLLGAQQGRLVVCMWLSACGLLYSNGACWVGYSLHSQQSCAGLAHQPPSAPPCPAAAGEESVQDFWASELPSSSSGGGDSSSSIVAAEVRDPYVLLQLSDGSAALLEVDAASCRLAVVEAPALQLAEGQGRVTACCLYADSCGWLRQHAAADHSGSGSSSSGGSMYCGVCRADGAFQLYSLPSWQLVFACDGLAQGPALLSSSGAGSRAAAAEREAAEVVELRLASFGAAAAGRHDLAAARASKAPACEAPVLLALTADHQLLAYRAFTPNGARSRGSSSSGGGLGGLSFRRLPLDVPPLMPPATSEQQQGGEAQQTWRLQRLHSFEGLGEETPYSGLFVAGAGQLFDACVGTWVCCTCYT